MKENSTFLSEWNRLQKDIHNTAWEKGWWDCANAGEKIALMHSELSEALEGLRHGNPPDDKLPGFNNVEVELADVVIRIMDFAEAFDMTVAEAIIAKARFNKGRAFKHGGKEF